MNTTAQLHIRSQHARKGRSGFGGPDKYVAVTIAPIGTTVPYVLNARVLKLRGIELVYMGQGYGMHTGPRSILGKTINEARLFVALHNSSQAETVMGVAA